MADDATSEEPGEGQHVLTREEILAAPLREFDAHPVGLRMHVLSHGNMVALMRDADNEDLDDRAFVVAAVARQIREPANMPSEVAEWDDDRLLAALATFVEEDSAVQPGEPVSFASFRAAIRAEAEARRARLAETVGPLDSQLSRVTEAIRNMADLKFNVEPHLDTVMLAPDYGAMTAAGVESLAAFQEASIEVAREQQLELVALNEGVGSVGAQQGQTNNELRALRDSTAPRWVTYATLVVAIAALVVALLATLTGLWSGQPQGLTTPAPSERPLASLAVSPIP